MGILSKADNIEKQLDTIDVYYPAVKVTEGGEYFYLETILRLEREGKMVELAIFEKYHDVLPSIDQRITFHIRFNVFCYRILVAWILDPDRSLESISQMSEAERAKHLIGSRKGMRTWLKIHAEEKE